MIDDLFRAVRRACSPPIWSRGVQMVREGAVIGQSADEEEIELKVTTGRGVLALNVALYPLDDEWSCDCNSRAPACEHVAAAVIAQKQAEADGRELPAASASVGNLRYRFRRDERGLIFDRVVVLDGAEEPLEVSLTDAAAGRVPAPPVAVDPHDLDVERVLGSRTRGRPPRELMPKLLELLVSCDDVRLDGEPVKASALPVVPWATVEDTDSRGFRLAIHPDPDIDEVFTNGAVRCGESLRPIGEGGLSREEIRQLSGEGRLFGPREVNALVTEVLPELQRRIRVEIRTKRLPRTSSDPPRIEVETAIDDLDRLVVEAHLVYGEPESARVVDGEIEVKGRAIPIRDEAEEARLVSVLRADLGLVPERPALLEAEEAVTFAARLKAWREGRTESRGVRGDGWQSFTLAPPIEARTELGGGRGGERFEVHFESPAGRADPARVLRQWQRGSALAPLEDGGWAPLPADFLGKHGHLVADLLAARDESGVLPRCALPDLARFCEAIGEPAPPGVAELRALFGEHEQIPPAELPGDLTATLRDYQRRGVDWLAFLRRAGLGALLADDMGLGKTLQALCVVEGRTLVVAPTSVLHNWRAEAERFRPGLKVSVYHGPNRSLEPDAELVLTTYAVLRLDVDALASETWDMVVLDEAQAIKNPESQVTRAAYRLSARFRLTLTGTPVENRLEELWSQFHFLNRGLLGERRGFDERYAKPIAGGETGAAGRLRSRIRPYLLRRLKREVAAELPPRTEVVLHATLDEQERAVYDAVRAAARKDIVERLRQGGSVLEALEALLRLRQAACHRGLIPGQEAERSSKVDLLLEVLDEAVSEGHKALVFSQWTSLLDRVEPHLERAGLDFVRLDGSTRDRGAVVDAFQAAGGPPVMLLSLKAGGTGLNLTAADHVFLLDPWWNPAVEDQAADRAHRIGQDRPVVVHRLVAEETVEERILALQEQKRSLAEAALGGADRAAGLGREELLSLLDG